MTFTTYCTCPFPRSPFPHSPFSLPPFSLIPSSFTHAPFFHSSFSISYPHSYSSILYLTHSHTSFPLLPFPYSSFSHVPGSEYAVQGSCTASGGTPDHIRRGDQCCAEDHSQTGPLLKFQPISQTGSGCGTHGFQLSSSNTVCFRLN